MPKIEVNEKLFFQMVGQKYDYDTLEKKLTCGKAELDEKPDMSVPEDQRVIKIELNDTNRPDLWSTNGVARQLRLHNGGTTVDYSKFLSREGDLKDSRNLTVTVDPELKDIRPYMVAFMIEGKAIDEPMLLDIIQTQEKLAWNFGRKRKSLSMGLYRASQIKWPVHYKAVDPDNTSFIPLTFEKPLTCRQILTEHPKGKDYGWILENFKKFPLLTDDAGEVMSMAPVINSATLGAVQVGDKDLMVELTGDNMANLLLAANIVACDFADCGYAIHPIRVDHPYDTGFGKSVCAPFYFQQPAKAVLKNVNKLLGSDFSKEQVVKALEVMGNKVEAKDADGDVEFTVYPAPYRNDFLHEVDIIEDVMIGIGLDNFKPAKPNDFTIGRLMPLTLFSRQAKNIMVGLGYQEMIFNYLGSKKDYIERMGIDDSKIIEVSNPMSENYQFVRPSIIPSLLRAESGSANAIFPHKIFEIGKVAYLCDEENTGTRTRQSLGFMTASSNANFNSAASEVSSLLYFLDHEYKVAESDDPRFIPGRQAAIIINGKQAGIFGEIHPQVLENWSITVPCVAGEIDVEELMAADNSKSSENAKKENSTPKAVVNQKSEAETNPIKYFNEHIELRVAKIEKVDVNPEGDKLYIETMDDGSGTPRIIQSGLRPYLKAEELIGQHVIIASNLAPRKMKGVESHGMLLACDYTEDGKEKVELLTAPWAKPGTIVCPAGSDSSIPKPAKIDIDHFCKVTMKIENHKMVLNGTPLTADGKEITTVKSDNCEVC
ncbi:MAG: phenylalanine--tRNA ligase subunit beta [Treponema sp.]|nr:phenylalanine--tRNA ligase subunit beta [Treponema sp.]